MKTLIAVAHPHDLAFFSSVLDGAHIALTTRSYDPAHAEIWKQHGVVSIAAGFDPARAREYTRVFTSSPLDADRGHQDLAATLAAAHPYVLVPAQAAPFDVANILDATAFDKKLALLNATYDPQACELDARAITAVETFSRATAADIARIRSLTHFDQVIEVQDAWSFQRSGYERDRFAATLAMIAAAGEREPLRSIIELGACEGLMTEAIAQQHREAKILAVEPSKKFAERLDARVAGLANVTTARIDCASVDLDADLIVAAEVLYYAQDAIPRMLQKSRARAWVTSYRGDFDATLAATFEKQRFRLLEKHELAPRYEPLLGARDALTAEPESGAEGPREGEVDRRTPFVVRRVGCTIRLWVKGLRSVSES